MSCAAVERWLDQGMPDRDAPEHLAHAASCPRCATAIAAAREIDAWLEQATFTSPAGITDHVMARIADASSVAARTTPVAPSPMSWWVRAAADPATVLAMVVAGLFAWRSADVLRLGIGAYGAMARATSGAARWFAIPGSLRALGGSTTSIAVVAIALAGMAWMSWELYRFSERRVARRLAASRV